MASNSADGHLGDGGNLIRRFIDGETGKGLRVATYGLHRFFATEVPLTSGEEFNKKVSCVVASQCGA